MSAQRVFKRYELKYILTLEQKDKVMEAMTPYMKMDDYGRTTIRNIYYDTDTYLLIRRSIEKPVYKEKLRIRSYTRGEPENMVFVELKKKYKHVVYKRRLEMPEEEAIDWIQGRKHCRTETQIAKEVDYFLDFYGNLQPAVFLSYEREAFYAMDHSDFRVTFDDTILYRLDNLSFQSKVYGIPILPEGKVLMEIKCSGGIPLWMTKILSAEEIYKTSFSKYGTAYKEMIFPQLYSEKKDDGGSFHVQ